MGIRHSGFLAPCLLAGPAAADPPPATHQALVSLAQDMVYTTARLYPMQATALGIPGHDGELDAPSEQARAADLARLKEWKSQVDASAAGFNARTSLADKDDAALLQAALVSNLDQLQMHQ